jgi:hypothetical protein
MSRACRVRVLAADLLQQLGIGTEKPAPQRHCKLPARTPHGDIVPINARLPAISASQHVTHMDWPAVVFSQHAPDNSLDAAYFPIHTIHQGTLMNGRRRLLSRLPLVSVVSEVSGFPPIPIRARRLCGLKGVGKGGREGTQ